MGLLNWIQLKYYHYNLWTGLYMLDPWEKLLFNSLVAFGVGMTGYYIKQYVDEEGVEGVILDAGAQ